jgi:DNA-binding transcriptional ArsR family regulator
MQSLREHGIILRTIIELGGARLEKYDRELYRIKSDFYKTLANPTRQMIITELHSGEKTASEISSGIELIPSVTSHHLGILRSKGIVEVRYEGTEAYYMLVNPKFYEAFHTINEILLSQLVKNREFANETFLK